MTRRCLKAVVFLAALLDLAPALQAGDMTTSLVTNGNALFLPMEIAGQRRMALLDTGAPLTSIAADEVSNRLPSQGKMTIHGTAGDQICDHITLPDAAGVASKHAIRCPNAFNLFGVDNLQGALFHLDMEEMRFILLDRNGQGRKQFATQFPLQRGRHGQIVLPCAIPGLDKGRCLFDTGWTITSVQRDIVLAHPDLFHDMNERLIARDATSSLEGASLYEVDDLVVGSLHFGRQIVSAQDLTLVTRYFPQQVDIILGLNLVEQANWTFDLSKERWKASFTKEHLAQPAATSAP